MPTFPSKNKTKKHTFVNRSTGAHGTRAQNIKDYLWKTAWIQEFGAENVCKLRGCLVITWFQHVIALGVKYDRWPYALRSSSICPKLFAGMPWSHGYRLPSERKPKTWFLATLTPDCSDVFEGTWLVGTLFRRQRPPKGINYRTGYVTLFRCSWWRWHISTLTEFHSCQGSFTSIRANILDEVTYNLY